jgi:hypothetical protein
MTRNGYVILALCCCLAAAVAMNSEDAEAEDTAVQESEYTVAAYYFPNYHVDARNEKQHGPGWSEWELVKHARPRFDGHQQPKEPLWGYTDEADPEEMARKIDAAADHGIDAFIFDWYYYDDGPFLQRAIEEGFFNAENNARLKFGVMWANHDWQNIHPKKRNCPAPVIYPGKITPATWQRMTDFLIGTCFSHPSYWKIAGKPYFSVYDLTKLMESFGSVNATRAALDDFRQRTRAAGHPDLHINAVVWGRAILPAEKEPADPDVLVKQLGFDSVTSYVWIHHAAVSEFPQTPYKTIEDRYFAYAEEARGQYDVPYYPNATMGWDSSPRACQSDVLTNEGYPFMGSLSGNTPEAFEAGLRRIRAFLDKQPAEDRIFNINCWNEWTEGSYLEPDRIHGYAYLEAIQRVFGGG